MVGRHVRDRIMDEHGIEAASEPDGAHIALRDAEFRRRLTANMPAEGSTRVISNRALRCDAVFPPPLPNSSRVCNERVAPAMSTRWEKAASSA